MDERVRRLESRVDELAQQLGDLAAKVGRLEASSEPPSYETAAPELATPSVPVSLGGAKGIAGLLGRTMLVLAGAFLLRALTDSGTLSQSTGVAAGLIYAGIWLYLADRDGKRDAAASSAAHGLTVAIIGFPLVWEATVRFHVWSPSSGAVVLLVLTAVALAVAWRRSLRAVAWVTSVGSSLTALVLLVSTHRVEPFTAALIVIGLATVWLAYDRRWFGIRWPAAAMADLAVLQATGLAAHPGGPSRPFSSLDPALAAGLGVLLFLAYGTSFTARTLSRRRNISPFEAIQMTLALLVGLGGAIRVARAMGQGVPLLGILALAVGAAAYSVAFTAVDRRLGRGRNFLLFSTLAVVLVLTGSMLLVPSWIVALPWVGLALVAAFVGARFDRITLRSHSVVYSLAALTATGVPLAVADAFTGLATQPWHPLSGRGIAVVAATTACYFTLAFTHRLDDATWRIRIPRFLLATLFVGGFAAWAVVLVRTSGLAESPAALAAARTVVLSATCLVAATLGRPLLLREMSWLTYPLLVASGLKVVLEDLRAGSPITLFVGFAAYGLALLIAPRLLRTRTPLGS